ncbi:SNARE domain-containing [Cryptosporidium sp. chipmunk genotype I]|uniref:SNARE domain-containing n=1 Tax=Cryptosporidium sp. chipmunk genotype I TaxID=1280935 RepID=UPI00351A4F71|nr:SNARE domain-containing [Cryptosporidium sp. chipmunk genotype I]
MERYAPTKEWEKESFNASGSNKNNVTKQTKVKDNKRYSRVESDYDFESGLNNWTQDENFTRPANVDGNINILENAVSQLKSVGYGIQSEINLHLDMLNEMNLSMDSTGRRIRISQKILNRLVDMASTMTLTIIAFLLFILLIFQWIL